MFILRVLLFMALCTVAHAHRYAWFHTMVSFTSNTPLSKVRKKIYSCLCHKFPTSVNGKGLMLLLLGGNVSLNPGPLMLGVLNSISIRNKGPLLANIVTSHDRGFLDRGFLCLTETHVCLSYTDSFR